MNGAVPDGTVTPIALLALTQVVEARRNGPQANLWKGRMPDPDRHFCHALERRDRGTVVFRSFLGYTTYKMSLVTREGLIVAIVLSVVPFVILWVLVKLLPAWPAGNPASFSEATPAH